MYQTRATTRVGSRVMNVPHPAYPKIYSTLPFHLYYSNLEILIQEISKYDTVEAI